MPTILKSRLTVSVSSWTYTLLIKCLRVVLIVSSSVINVHVPSSFERETC